MALQPVAWKAVTIRDSFWSPRQEINRRVTITHEYKMCRDTGRIDAFDLTWKPGQPNEPHVFWDSDVGKWIEAASYSLAVHPDPKLDRLLDEVVAKIAKAQQPDGYLNCHFTVVAPEKRWSNLRDWHELYCAGHLMEGAVAHYQATGKRTLLDVLCRYADHIDLVFGRKKGQKRGYCGHPEVELALVRLADVTGQEKYLRLAEYFVDERGRLPHYYDAEARARGEDPNAFWARTYAYCQAHKPLREQSEVNGHAVRAFYIYSAMADVAVRTRDAGLLAACKRLWRDVTTHKLYVTGGLGPSRHNEGFTQAYDLPNESAYAETCAAIALVFFAHRMLQIDADGRYADVMESALYNGAISGVSQDGTKFFYVNPLASYSHEGQAAPEHLSHTRREWFGCACCPPNIARLIASIGSYVYSTSATAAYVHLYVAGQGRMNVGGSEVMIDQKTNYPWDGRIELTIGAPGPLKFDLMLRIPGWCRRYRCTAAGRTVRGAKAKGYLRLRRTWVDGDRVVLTLSMPAERVAAHPFVDADVARVALQRGPIVYCLEQCDNQAEVRTIILPDKARLSVRFDRKLLGGVAIVEARAIAARLQPWKDRLYLRVDEAAVRKTKIKAIPYCLWNNRGPCAMTVWLGRT